jgi:hypothetical protein
MSRAWRTAPVPEQLRKMQEFTAVWCPYWYDLDQPIAVGKRTQLSFGVHPEEQISAQVRRWHASPPDAIFYGGLGGDGLWFDVDSEIVALRNSVLGAVQRITSQGLDYTVKLESGRELLVNSEEHPGAIWDPARRVWLHEFEEQDWTMVARVRQYGHVASPPSLALIETRARTGGLERER